MTGKGKSSVCRPAAVLGAAFWFVVAFCIKWRYAVNDDRAIENILNGSFTGTPDSHGIYLLYPLGSILKMLYLLWNQADWYRIVMTGIYAWSLALVIRRLIRRFELSGIWGWLSGLGLVGAVSVLWAKEISVFTYSTCGAFAAAMLVFAYALQSPKEDVERRNLFEILLLFCLTYSIRKECCYMAFPFLGILWLWKNGRQIFTKKSCWVIPAAGVLCFAGMFGINQLAYGSRQWKDYWAYNKERTYLQDYKHYPDYDENQEFFDGLGMTREEYKGVRNYTYLLLDDYSEEKLHEIYLLAQSREGQQTLGEKLKKAAGRMVE